jgi:hypothetical protein
MFSFTELRDWLLEAGSTGVTGHGEDGAPLAMDSPMIVSPVADTPAERRPPLVVCGLAVWLLSLFRVFTV